VLQKKALRTWALAQLRPPNGITLMSWIICPSVTLTTTAQNMWAWERASTSNSSPARFHHIKPF